MTGSRRRGACPGLSAPMPTGDGLLVRLMPAAPVPLDAMTGLCEAAARHGNGIIEITARGSLQVRGLTPRSAPLFAAAVADLGIDARDGVPVIAGFDDRSVDVLAAELRRAIADARLSLSPKVSVVVDGSGPLHLDGLSADVRLRAVESVQGPQFHLGISGGAREKRGAAGGDAAPATWLGTVAAKDAAGAVLQILTMIAAHGPAARAADIPGRKDFAAFPAIDPVPAPPSRTPAEMIGVHAMRDDAVAIGVGLAFGHTHADALADLVQAAVRHGMRAARPTPDRALLMTGVSARDAHSLTTAAEWFGFVADPDDPRRRIAACPGAPACASGLIPARTLASALAPVLPNELARTARGVAVHISGCPKGCAHPGPAALTIIGTPQGCGVVHDGAAHETPHRYIDPARVGDALSRLADKPAEAAHG
jgi:precorrin-3B synthase